METDAAESAPVTQQPEGGVGEAVTGRVGSDTSQPLDTPTRRWHDRWLFMARAAWAGLAMITVGMFLASLPARYMQLRNYSGDVRVGLDFPAINPAQLSTSSQFYASYNLGLEVFYALLFLMVALLIFWRVRNDRMALLASLALLTFGTTSIPTVWPLVETQTAWYVPATTLRIIGWFSIAALLFLFPNGRFAPRWTLWVFVIYAAHLTLTLYPSSPLFPEKWPVPHALLNLLAWGSGVYSLIYKYRNVLGPVQRQQTKWVVFGMVVGVSGALAATLPMMLDQPSSSYFHPGSLFHELVHVPLVYAFLALVPLSIGISILHYRLWDIDVIINRTLVYLPLTGVLAGLYSASMVAFQKLSVAITGERSDAAIVLTTLVMASVFTPVKQKVQDVVDTHYKHVRDPAGKLKEFNRQMEAFIEMNDARELTGRALDEVVGAFGARYGAIYLYSNPDRRRNGRQGPDTGVRPVHTAGQWPSGDDTGHIGDMYEEDETGDGKRMCLPLLSSGNALGLLQLGPRLDSSEYSAQDRECLQHTVDLIGRTLPLAKRMTHLPDAGDVQHPA